MSGEEEMTVPMCIEHQLGVLIEEMWGVRAREKKKSKNIQIHIMEEPLVEKKDTKEKWRKRKIRISILHMVNLKC